MFVTNHKFINSFAGWQNETVSRAKITVLDDKLNRRTKS